jgi:hypothetical protein
VYDDTTDSAMRLEEILKHGVAEPGVTE